MRRAIIFISLISTVLIIAVIEFHFGEFIKPKLLEVTNVEVREINKDTVSIDVGVRLHNNFFIDFEIIEIKVKTLSKNDTIGIVNSNSKSTLTGNDTSEVILPAKFRTTKLAKLLEENTDSIKLKLKGLITAKILFFTKSIDLDEDFNIALKAAIIKAIEKFTNESESFDKMIEIRGAKLIDVGLKYSKVLINFTLKNPYDIPIKLISYPSEIYINNNYSGRGNLKEEVQLNARGEVLFGEFEFEIQNLQGIKSLFKSFFTAKMTYKTLGDLHFSILGYKIKIPYSSTGEIIKL